jgi:hypothetical protein
MNYSQQMLEEISRLMEKQYRKGVQHGAISKDEESANKFRYNGMLENYNNHEHFLDSGNDNG